MRRLLRWSFAALSLLSLLACAGIVWLRLAATPRAPAWVEIAAAGNDLTVCSYPGGLTIDWIGRWPGGAWAGAGRGGVSDVPGVVTSWAPPQEYTWGILSGSGQMCIGLRPDGTPDRQRVSLGGAAPPGWVPHWSHPLPYREVSRIPGWLAMALLAATPVLWLGLRLRRLEVLRRRRRLGRCVRCGYDLTGNTSGRCSECGEKVEPVRAEGRVTA